MSGTVRRRTRFVRRKKKSIDVQQGMLPGMATFMHMLSTQSYYERLLERDPTCLEAIQWLTRQHLILAGTYYEAQESRDEHLTKAQRLLRRWPESRRDSLYYVMCKAVLTILEARLDADEEAQLLERAIRQFKPENDWTGTTNADFLFRLGAAYYHRGRVREKNSEGSGVADLETSFMLVNLAVRIFPSHNGYRQHIQTIAKLLKKTHVLEFPSD